jgi:nucleoside-diphosphate-sugar epimerase
VKVLIIGGTGFISGHIAEAAEAAGHDVVLFNRGKSDPHTHFNCIAGDAKNLAASKAELLAEKPDVVVHCVAYNDKQANDLVSVFEGTKAHLIVLSSADCYEAFQKLNRGEAADQPVREDSELSKTKYYLKSFGMPDYDKNLMTEALLQAHKDGKVAPTVFRVPMVYGPRDRQYAYRHGEIIKHLADGQKEMVVSSTTRSQLYTYGYVENVAAAVVHSFGLPQTVGQVYNLGENQARAQSLWTELYAEAAGKELKQRVVPPEVLGGEAGEAPRAFIMDCSKFARDTGFKEPVSLKESVQRTYDWAIAHPEALKNVRADYAGAKAKADAYESRTSAKPAAPQGPKGP